MGRYAIWVLTVFLLLMSFGTSVLWLDMPHRGGIDFFQFWGMAKAQRQSHYQLGSPYQHRVEYQQYFRAMVVQSQDRHMALAVGFRQDADPTGTPLLYYLMGHTPAAYTPTLQIFRALQVATFLGTVILLLRPLSPALGLLAVALTAAYSPLVIDLEVGNLSCLQVLGLTLIAAAIARKRSGALWPSLLSGALTFLMLFKPNVGSAISLLGLCLLAQYSRYWLHIFATAIGSAVILYVLSCVSLGSWSAWIDWYRFSFSPHEIPGFATSDGNFSGVKLLENLGLSATTATSISFALVVLPLSWGKLAWSRFLADPYLALATGITLMIALSPLVWVHYHVLAVMPIVWLLRSSNTVSRIAGIVSLLLFADLAMNLNTIGGGVPHWAVLGIHSFAWVPLWYGIVWTQLESSAKVSEQAPAYENAR